MKRTHVAFDDEEQRRIESIQQVYEECQWAYATALHDVPDAVDSNTIVVKSGARVMVTYPMRKGIDDRVEMKIKNIDKDTGQLIASWVVAYDAKQRFLGDFGISP